MIKDSIEGLKKRLVSISSVARLKPFDVTSEEGRSKERYRKVVLSTGSSVFYKVTTIATSLISIPLTVNYLGVERFGLWMTITSILALMVFADFGLGNGLVNAIAKSEGTDDKKCLNKSISSAFFILLGLSILIGLIFFIVYPLIRWESIFNVKSQIAIDESGPAFAVLMIVFLINLPLGVIQKIQLGYQLGYKNDLWLGLGAVLGLVGVLTAIYFELGLPYLVALIVGGPLIAVVLNGFFLFKNKPYIFPKISKVDLSISKQLIGVGLVFFLLQMFTVIGNSLDNIIIAQILGASAVASYAVTKKIFLVIQISQFIIVPLWPAFIESIARKDFKWAKNTLIKILKLSLSFGALSALPLLFFGQSIIRVWVSPEVVPSLSLLIGFFFWTFLVNYGGSMSVFLNNETLIKTTTTNSIRKPEVILKKPRIKLILFSAH